MNRTTKELRFISVLTVAATVTACGGVVDTETTGSELAPEAKIRLQLAKAPDNGLQAINVVVTDVSLRIGSGGWTTIASNKTIDLLQPSEFLATLPPATYTEVRLKIASASVKVNGQTFVATVPSGEVKLKGTFQLVSGFETRVSLKYTKGVATKQNNGTYRISPVLRLVSTTKVALPQSTSDAGTIAADAGSVQPDAGTIVDAGSAPSVVQTPAGFVRVAAGSCVVGPQNGELGSTSSEQQQRHTALYGSLLVKETEVTQGEYLAVAENPSAMRNCGSNCPVDSVSWNQAVDYANRLAQNEGLMPCYNSVRSPISGCTGYRLPTDDEWECLARAGTTTTFYTGNITQPYANEGVDPALDIAAWNKVNARTSYVSAYYDSIMNAQLGSQPVKGKQANAFGLYDMLGNVREWTETSFLASGAQDLSGTFRRVRGGGYADDAVDCRAAHNNYYGEPTMRTMDVGFRLVRSVL